MAEKLSLVMVNYLNAVPFMKGMDASRLSEEIEIKTANPALCASVFENGGADIALIPAGALHDLDDYKIITDYCIGCDGEVRTVCIFSQTDIRECKRLLLDNHSRTSVLLAKLIVEQYFGLQLPFESLDIQNWLPREGDAILMIGDKVFEHEKKFSHKYDLGSIWKIWTGLPFVFAVWVAKRNLDSSVEIKLNDAFKKGMAMLPQMAGNQEADLPDLATYYTRHIKYGLDGLKREALQRYLDMSAKYHKMMYADDSPQIC